MCSDQKSDSISIKSRVLFSLTLNWTLGEIVDFGIPSCWSNCIIFLMIIGLLFANSNSVLLPFFVLSQAMRPYPILTRGTTIDLFGIRLRVLYLLICVS